MLLLLIVSLLTAQGHCAGNLPKNFQDVEGKTQTDGQRVLTERHNQEHHQSENSSKTPWHVVGSPTGFVHQPDSAAPGPVASAASPIPDSFQSSTSPDVKNSIPHRDLHKSPPTTLTEHGVPARSNPIHHRHENSLHASNNLPQFGNHAMKRNLDSKEVEFSPYVFHSHSNAPDESEKTPGLGDDNKNLLAYLSAPMGIYQHHLGKRSFDSIGNGRMSGLNQNYLRKRPFDHISGGSLSGIHQNHLDKRQMNYAASGDSPVLDEALLGDDQTYLDNAIVSELPDLAKRQFDSIGSGSLSGMHQNHLNKRNFDSINRGRLSGLSQNYLGKRNFDSIGGGRLSGLSQNYLGKRNFDSIGSGRMAGLSQNYLGKRNFDSIGGGRLSGLSQNYLGKRNFDSISNGRMSGLSENYLGKRNFDSIGSGRMAGLSQNYLGKRNFDSIGGGRLSGLSQNYLGKRNFDSISNGRLSGLSGNYLGKRNFDSIGSGRMAGLSQNYLGKRNFDSISNGRLSGLHENHLGKRHFDSIGSGKLAGLSQNYLGKRNFDSIGSGRMAGFHQNHVAKRHTNIKDQYQDQGEASGLLQHHIAKRSFDSIDSGRLARMYQNYIEKRHYDPIGNGVLSGLGQNHINKRSFDAISYGNGVFGLSQNYIDKKLFDRIGENSGISGLRQNYVEKKGFDPISRGALSGIHQNYLGKKRFDSISNGNFAGLYQNFVAKRNYDVTNELADSSQSDDNDNYVDEDDEDEKTFIDKRLDAISDGALGGMRQNFFDKKYFDSISRGSLSEMRQNFLGKRHFDSIASGRLGGMRQNFASKRFSPYLPSGGNGEPIFLSPESNFDQTGVPSTDTGDFQEKFNAKRQFHPISDSRLGGLNQNFIGKREIDFADSRNDIGDEDDSELEDGEGFFIPHSLEKRSLELSELTSDKGVSGVQQKPEKREIKRNLYLQGNYLHPSSPVLNAEKYPSLMIQQYPENIGSRPGYETSNDPLGSSYVNLHNDVPEDRHGFSHYRFGDAFENNQDSSPSRYTTSDDSHAEIHKDTQPSSRNSVLNIDNTNFKIPIKLPTNQKVTDNDGGKTSTSDGVTEEAMEENRNNKSHGLNSHVSNLETEQSEKDKILHR